MSDKKQMENMKSRYVSISKRKKKKKYVQDLKDLISGLGIGLCFSKFYLVGILLIVIAIVTSLIELEKEKELNK